jgi:mRNA interferase RelE/StbE
MKRINYSKDASKALSRMSANMAKLIRSKIEQYASDPAPLANNVKALRGRPGFRLRVGDWRVIFDEIGDVIDILEIGPRGRVYD